MRIPGIVPNTAAETAFWQHMDVVEECRARRLSSERRFAPRSGCPYGCDGSGWNELSDHLEPEEGLDIFYQGRWLTACECNISSTWRGGVWHKWPRKYPEGYDGLRVGPPQ